MVVPTEAEDRRVDLAVVELGDQLHHNTTATGQRQADTTTDGLAIDPVDGSSLPANATEPANADVSTHSTACPDPPRCSHAGAISRR